MADIENQTPEFQEEMQLLDALLNNPAATQAMSTIMLRTRLSTQTPMGRLARFTFTQLPWGPVRETFLASLRDMSHAIDKLATAHGKLKPIQRVQGTGLDQPRQAFRHAARDLMKFVEAHAPNEATRNEASFVARFLTPPPALAVAGK
ncbi:MAG TPA: hypothetical protein VHB73_07215 [Alphaproteobacteria bacterium]|nr:hypothetical protein [Alphaproteobacteria bacterium]